MTFQIPTEQKVDWGFYVGFDIWIPTALEKKIIFWNPKEETKVQ